MPNFYYNLTNLTNVNNTIVDLMKFGNEATGGVFWFMSVFAVFAILFISISFRFGTSRALMTSSFVATVYSVFLATLGLMDISLVMIPMIITVFVAIVFAINER